MKGTVGFDVCKGDRRRDGIGWDRTGKEEKRREEKRKWQLIP